ncbi:DNA-binding transcriptional regulator YdaS (Cro superfamily) [Paraburkholderia sp. JPY465]|uniref:helix-turn-helix domain-containing protein n=1 Tax=Paraburkholderia sp. JPY465 TaxID=3042285 RepID=UPI003D1BE3E5
MNTPDTCRDALIRAIEIVGSQSALARALGKSQPYVPKWLKSRKGLPPEYCPPLERLTRRSVRCEELSRTVDWAYVRNGALVDHVEAMVSALASAGFDEVGVRICLMAYVHRVVGSGFFE